MKWSQALWSILCVLSFPGASPSDDADRTILETIAAAYESNRAALDTHGSVRFGLYDGLLAGSTDLKAETLEGQPRQRLSEGHGRYMFRSPLRLYDHSFSLEEDRKQLVQVSATVSESPISNYRMMTDGSTILFDGLATLPGVNDINHTATLVHDTKQFMDHLDFPLSLGNPEPKNEDLGSILKGYAAGQSNWVLDNIERQVSLGEESVLLLRFHSVKEGHVLRCWVDIAKGAVPRRMQVQDKDHRLVWATALEDVRYVGNRGWLPFRQLRFYPNFARSPNRPGNGVRFWEIEIEEADLDSAPTDSAFVLEFPVPTSIVNADTHVIYPQTDRWDLKAISPQAAAKGRSLGSPAQPPVGEPMMPGERPALDWWLSSWLVLGLCFLGVSGWLLFRRLARAH